MAAEMHVRAGITLCGDMGWRLGWAPWRSVERPPNNSMQPMALRAAADGERYRSQERSIEFVSLYLPNSARLQNFEGFLRRFDPRQPCRLDFQMHDRWVNVHPVVLAFSACVEDLVKSNGGRFAKKALTF
jgi:hypothetical protein